MADAAAEEKCVIKTELFGKTEFVPMKKSDMTDFEAYIDAVLDAFKVEFNKDAVLYLRDASSNAKISRREFGTIVKQFIQCSHFVIKITVSSNVKDGEFHKELEQFLRNSTCKALFAEYDRTENLSVKTLGILADKLLVFINDKFEKPNREEITSVCSAALIIFPNLTTPTSSIGGIDRLYNWRAKTGPLYHKINYQKYGRNKSDINGNVENDNECDEGLDHPTLTYNEELEHMLFFRTCLVSRDKEILKIRLKQTIALREKVLRKKETKFPQAFPFYFISPDLILYDFEIRFEKCNASGLIEKWPKVQKQLLLAFKSDDVELCLNMFDESIGFFFILLMAFCVRKNFEGIAEKFVLFMDDETGDPLDCVDKNNVFPQIIAVGKDKSSATNYYIYVEEHVISVPTDFDFLHTMDLFVKCHRVFHVHYSPACKTMCNFLDHYFLENHMEGATARMVNVSEKILKDV